MKVGIIMIYKDDFDIAFAAYKMVFEAASYDYHDVNVRYIHRLCNQELHNVQVDFIRLRYSDGKSFNEISKILDRSESDVYRIDNLTRCTLSQYKSYMSVSNMEKILNDAHKEIAVLRQTVAYYHNKSDSEGFVDRMSDFGFLSARSKNCLKRLGIRTSDELRELSCDDLMKTKNLGRATLVELLNMMKSCGHGDWSSIVWKEYSEKYADKKSRG
jgi:DNA-directed RNA polymerase alpha subunit